MPVKNEPPVCHDRLKHAFQWFCEGRTTLIHVPRPAAKREPFGADRFETGTSRQNVKQWFIATKAARTRVREPQASPMIAARSIAYMAYPRDANRSSRQCRERRPGGVGKLALFQ